MFGREPVLWLSTIQAGLALAIGFGAPVTPEQMGLVLAFSAALIGLITRTQVTPINGNSSNNLMKVILILALVGGTISACTNSQLKIALQAENQIHEGLRRGREGITQICPPTNLTETCSVTKSSFNTVLDGAAAYNRALANRSDWVAQGKAFLTAIQQFVATVQQYPEMKDVVNDVLFAQGGIQQ